MPEANVPHPQEVVLRVKCRNAECPNKLVHSHATPDAEALFGAATSRERMDAVVAQAVRQDRAIRSEA